MKRYLAFHGLKYYPFGGMNDFVGDYPTLEDAKSAIQLNQVKDGCDPSFYWAHVWDCIDQKTIWSANDEY